MSDDVIQVGAKVRQRGWVIGSYIDVIAIDGNWFWGRDNEDPNDYGTWLADDSWERYVEPPKPTAFTNLYPGGYGSRERADAKASPNREAVAIRWSDGSWTVEDVR